MAVFAALFLPGLACPAVAAAGPIALVIGNADYTAYPALPACSASAGLVASQLTRAGFAVTLKSNLSNGAFGAALSDFADQARQAPQSPALVYVCAYGGSVDGRDFILPVSASLTRPSDIMTEGLVARSALSFAAARSGASILAIDLVDDPAIGLGPPTGSAAAGQLAQTASVLVVSETRPPAAATLFAAAVAKQSAAADANSATLLPNVAHALAGAAGVTIAGVKGAAMAAALSGPPAPAEPAAPGAPVTPPAPLAAREAAMPDDDAMMPPQRRLVQIALAKLGYYDGRLDGIFGPDSRAAIRRYQHEIGAPMSGTLTAAQASRLVPAAP
jgi:hypothetical protein